MRETVTCKNHDNLKGKSETWVAMKGKGIQVAQIPRIAGVLHLRKSVMGVFIHSSFCCERLLCGGVCWFGFHAKKVSTVWDAGHPPGPRAAPR